MDSPVSPGGAFASAKRPRYKAILSIMQLEIRAAVATKIGFASHQNSVPLLREMEILNSSGEALEDLDLTITADPPFIEPRRWKLDRLSGESALHLNDRDVKLNGAYLGNLTEMLRGEVRVRIARGEETIAEVCHPVELLARNEWGGAGTMAELLPAFVMPNDPAVATLLKAASEVLRRAGKAHSIDGYNSGSRQRVWELVSALWSAVAGMRITYALPPASFENEGQKVRTPGTIVDGRIGTCLDTALLFAAAAEQAGLNPLLILTRGHAFVGVWLQPQEFSSLITEEAAAVRKRVDLDELLIFETTLVTASPVPRFDQAVGHARQQISEPREHEFIMAVDVRRARMQRIKPLAVALRVEAVGTSADVGDIAESLLEAPQLPGFDVELSEAPTAPADRVMQWQRKLLDLTTRNRLLHLPPNAKVAPLHCPDPAALEDLLAEGKKLKVRPLPELESGGRDSQLFRQQEGVSLLDEYARSALERGEVLSPLEHRKLEATVIDLYRKAKSDLEEGGANTLFLAVGFLKWKKSENDPKQYRAPLILLPVKLERKSAMSGVTLTSHEDEPRFNLTLLELLRQDFDLKIGGLEGPLPGDNSGVDVRGVWNMVRRAVRDLPGFEVVEDVVIGTFSFAKYLMWKDLVDRADQLKESPIVKHLIERGAEPFASSAEYPAVRELDQRIDPSKLFAPLPADSSQIAAIVASGEGCDFVLDGPPGTGKSQTIANMIAHNLALGRRVLFVAEKRAALDVVYRRLAERGLGDFCLELHSNKTSKLDVLKQLGRAWDVRDSMTEEEWIKEAGEVRRLRDSLNEVVALLHTPHSNGLTLHAAIGRVVRDADGSTPRLAWPPNTIHSREDLTQMRDVVRRLGIAGAAVGELPERFAAIATENWSNAWQEELVAAASELPARIDSLVAARDRLAVALQSSTGSNTLREVEALVELGEAVLATHGRDFSFAFAPEFPTTVATCRNFIEVLSDYRRVEGELSCRYAPEAARRLDIGWYKAELTKADAKFWVLATWARKRLSRRLADEGGAAGMPDIRADLSRLERLHLLIGEVDRLQPTVKNVPGSSALLTDIDAVSSSIEIAERLRRSISKLASTPAELLDLRRQVSAVVVDANELLTSEGALAMAHASTVSELGRFRAVSERLSDLAAAPALHDTLGLDAQRSLAEAIEEHRAALRAWCAWNRVSAEAIMAGLEPMVEAVAAGETGPEAEQVFETAYARWFAAEAIDAEPRISQLITDVHMNDIESYRQLEDRLSSLSVRYTRSKLCGRIPDRNYVGRNDGYGILKHQLKLQRRHKPVRQLAAEMGDAFTTLAPCMLMSPLSIAQYLPPDQALFDLVIFDEASQITPWDAIGSIARGKQVVIAGDPRQMPPSSFFNRAAGGSDDESTEEDMESILDECLGAGVPQHSLEWHYRSRHESLIAFSNNRYYENALITFPSPERRESAVSWRKVDGVYAKGQTRTNVLEAKAIVDEAVRRLTDSVPVEARKSLAIVTLNSEQQRLVEDLLDDARRRNPSIEPFFGDDQLEPVVVKNLETVQGDERDVILLGIGYGPTEPGAKTMSMNFGPLNREGGWRRLNVAATRAREEMVLFTSFDSWMIDLHRTSARAVHDLKHFIEFAERGPRALAEATQGSLGEHESPLEEAVAAALRKKGWTVVPQIGVSRFRIDLGIVHPERPGDYLVGVECDGATYHSAATARDRDKVRAAILEGLGWKLLRVWSTDWWVDREGAAERLHQKITALLDTEREARSEVPSVRANPVGIDEVFDRRAESPVGAERYASAKTESPVRANDPTVDDPDDFLAPAARAKASHYRLTDFDPVRTAIDPGAFYEPRYVPVLADLIRHVLDYEAPISEPALVERIARAHGFQRAGRIIRERVVSVAQRRFHLANGAAGGTFVWHDEAARLAWDRYRVPASEQFVRPIEDIAPEELKAAALVCTSDDHPLEIARLFGIRRLSSAARDRILESLSGRSGPDPQRSSDS